VRAAHSPQHNWAPVIVMIAVAIVLTIGQHRARGSAGVSFAERAAWRVVWPVQSSLVTFGTVLRNLNTAALHGGRLARENEELRRRVAELEADKMAMYTYYLDNMAMRKKLGWDATGVPMGTPARVINWSSGPQGRRITIEASSPLEPGNIVRTEAGLVGRVYSAEGNRGTVVMLITADHAVAARILRENGDHGIVYAAPPEQGNGQMLVLSKLPQSADVRVGDRVVSSGQGGVYPDGLPIGVVERVERSEVNVASIVAYVKPFADFDHLDYVRVIRRGG